VEVGKVPFKLYLLDSMILIPEQSHSMEQVSYIGHLGLQANQQIFENSPLNPGGIV
jgi:hypothetical protein